MKIILLNLLLTSLLFSGAIHAENVDGTVSGEGLSGYQLFDVSTDQVQQPVKSE